MFQYHGSRTGNMPDAPPGEAAPCEGRLLFTLTGMVVVTVQNGSWLLSPQRALWVPDCIEHESSARKSGVLRTLPLSGDGTVAVPRAVRLLAVSSFFRALLVEALREERAGSRATRALCLRSLILSEFATEPAPAGRMAAPHDTRLRNICEAILADPSDGRTIDQWARAVGMSRRALTRKFRLQTGMSLAVWRQQARLEAASARLRMGERVTRVGYEVGYESVATFSMIFRQNFGTTPSRYARSDTGTDG